MAITIPSARLWRGVFWLLAGVIAVLSLVPGEDAIPVGYYDKLAHSAAYATLAMAGGLSARTRAGLWWVVTFCALYGGAIEILQTLVPQRSCEFLDFVADGMGGLVGAAIALSFRSWLTRGGAAVLR